MVPPASRKVSRVSRYSGYHHATHSFEYGAFTLFGLLSQNSSSKVCWSIPWSSTPESKPSGLACFHFARRYFENRFFFLLLLLLRCFSSERFPSIYYFIHIWITEVFSARFPHSDIPGSLTVCVSPRLFAAFYVLHRLLVPRHSPCALCILSYIFQSFDLIYLFFITSCDTCYSLCFYKGMSFVRYNVKNHHDSWI